MLDGARQAIRQYSTKEEDAISYALFPEVTLEWLKALVAPKEEPPILDKEVTQLDVVPTAETLDHAKVLAISAAVIQQFHQQLES